MIAISIREGVFYRILRLCGASFVKPGGRRLDLVPSFESVEKVTRESGLSVDRARVGTADERDGVGISSDVSGGGEEVGYVANPADQEERERDGLVDGDVVSDHRQSAIEADPLVCEADGGVDLVAEGDVFKAGVLLGEGESVGAAADGVVDEHRDGDRARVRRRMGVGDAAGPGHPLGDVDRLAVGEPERDGDADAAGGVGGDSARFAAVGEEEVTARGVHGAVGEPQFLVHVHPDKGGRIRTLRVGAVGKHPGYEEHQLGVVGELPGFQPGVRVPPPRPAVAVVEALEVGRRALPRHAERVPDGGPEETALELIEHLSSISLKIPLKGCHTVVIRCAPLCPETETTAVEEESAPQPGSFSPEGDVGTVFRRPAPHTTRENAVPVAAVLRSIIRRDRREVPGPEGHARNGNWSCRHGTAPLRRGGGPYADFSFRQVRPPGSFRYRRWNTEYLNIIDTEVMIASGYAGLSHPAVNRGWGDPRASR